MSENTTATNYPSRPGELVVLQSSSPWRAPLAALFVSLTLVTVLYWPTFRSMTALWHTSAFSHGVLIIPTSLYLIWTRRRILARLRPVPTAWAIPPLIIVTFLWLLGNLSATAVVQQFCFIALVILVVWGELGTAVARTLLVPLAFLFFAVPFGEGLIPTLQDFSARFAVKFLELSGVPVLLEGRYITVPYGKWEVAEACSGLRFLVASLAVGFLFAGVAYRTWLRRLTFLLASAAVPILANGLRVYGIVLLGYFDGEGLAARVDHKISGLFFFSLVMITLLALGMRWREKPLRQEDSSQSTEQLAQALPLPAARGHWSYFAPGPITTISALVLIAILAPFLAKSISGNSSSSNDTQLAEPLVSMPWTASQPSAFDWKPISLSPSSEVSQTYESASHDVKIYVGYYRPGHSEGKLVSSGNEFYDKTHWLRSGESNRSAVIDHHPVLMHEIFAQSDNSSLLVWYCYWIDGTFTSNAYWAKFLLAKSRLSRSNQGAAIVAVATDDLGQRKDSAAILQDFLNHVVFSLDAKKQALAPNSPHI